MKKTEFDEWPFDQPKNCAVLTMRQVMRGLEPILLVTHDDDDDGWQFIGITDASMEDGMVVSLEEIVKLDSSILEVADLPIGWHAMRSCKGGCWKRFKKSITDE